MIEKTTSKPQKKMSTKKIVGIVMIVIVASVIYLVLWAAWFSPQLPSQPPQPYLRVDYSLVGWFADTTNPSDSYLILNLSVTNIGYSQAAVGQSGFAVEINGVIYDSWGTGEYLPVGSSPSTPYFTTNSGLLDVTLTNGATVTGLCGYEVPEGNFSMVLNTSYWTSGNVQAKFFGVGGTS
jgi:hypothetical protein